MSKSKDSNSSKSEKFSCIANCLPMKGCLHLGGKHNKKAKTLPNTASVTYNLASGKKAERREAVFDLGTKPDADDPKTAHTKKWLANLSTMVSVDPSYLEDTGMNDTLVDDQQTPTGVKTQGLTSRRARHLSDGGNKENSRTVAALMMSGDDSVLQMKMGGAARHNTPCDSFVSTSTDCDSSYLSSRCCSQQQHYPSHRSRHYRHRLDRTGSSASAMSTSTLGQEGGWHHDDHGDTSSICSGSSSTVSLATELVTLDLDACSHLGITIVGHSNTIKGDYGIFIGCVKKGGAAARSGRIEPGDLILAVNDIDVEKMSNEQALAVLKGELGKGGLIRILVAKYWDMTDAGQGDAPGFHQEPLYEAVGSVRSAPMSRPGSVCGGRIIDPAESGYRCSSQPPGARALRAIPESSFQQGGPSNKQRVRDFHEAAGMSSSELEKLYDLSKAAKMCSTQPKQRNSVMSSSSSVHTSYPDSGYHETAGYRGTMGPPGPGLPQHSMTLDRRLRTAAASRSGGGYDPPGAAGEAGTTRPFRGIELIDWIQGQVSGLSGRKDAQRYAQNLLSAGHISTLEGGSMGSSPDGDNTFQEHRYYAFGHTGGAIGMQNEARQSKML